MKQHWPLILILLAYSCNGDRPSVAINANEQIVPPHYLLKSANAIFSDNDTVFLNGKKYSGFLYEMSPNGNDTISLEGYVNGLLSGGSKNWFPNRQLLDHRYYRQGKKNGRQMGFWSNGNKRFEFVAKDGDYEGELREWGENGHLFHLGNFVSGHEEGKQKMWYENGKIRSNYVILGGKRYGLLGTKNCKNVSDSIFIVK